MRRRAVLWVALLVALPLAGCGAVPGSDGPSRPTVTPAAVPTDRATATPDPSAAPGVADDGTVDPVALSATHREALMGRSFTRTVTTVVSEDGERLRRSTERYRVAPYRTRFRYERAETVVESYPVRSVAERLELWSNGSIALLRIEDDGSVRYLSNPSERYSSLVAGITADERVSALTGAFAFEVRERPHALTVRLVGTELRSTNALDRPILTESVSDASLTVELGPSGLVRSYRLAYDVGLDDRRLRVVETMSITRVGRTRVEPPAWFPQAVAVGGDGTDGDSTTDDPGSDPTADAVAARTRRTAVRAPVADASGR